MEDFNYMAILVAAIVTFIIGFAWYNPKLFGTTWMREAEMTEEKMKSGNMAVIFIVTLILSFILAFFVLADQVSQFLSSPFFERLNTTPCFCYPAFYLIYNFRRSGFINFRGNDNNEFVISHLILLSTGLSPDSVVSTQETES